MKYQYPAKNLTLTLAFGLFGAATVSSAQVIVYEGFDYGAVGEDFDAYTSVGTEPTGLSGTGTGQWADPDGGNDMFLKSGSLNFSNLSTSGNHIGFESNLSSDRFNRALDSTAQTSIDNLGSSNGTLYFSFLFEKLQDNFGADHEGFALMNGVLPEARWDSGNSGASGRHGFAVAAVNDGSNLQAVGYDGTAGTRTVGSNSVPIAVVNGGSNTSTSNVAVNFIVGEISFNTGASGADVFKLYNAADDGSLDQSDLTLIDTIEFNMDESTLSTLNLTRQVNVNYDEVRIGQSFNDVLPVPPSQNPPPSRCSLVCLA